MAASNAALLTRRVARQFVLVALRVHPFGDRRFERGIRWPAEPGVVAVRAQRLVALGIDAVHPGMHRVKHVPAALAGRRFLRAPPHHGAPVGRDEIDVDAEPAEEIDGDLAHRRVLGLILRRHAHDGLAGVAGLREQALRRIKFARSLENLSALFVVKRRAGRNEARHRLPQRGVVANDGAHVVLLAHRHQDRAPRPHVVERRMQVIHAEAADIAERVGDVDPHVAIALEQRRQVGERLLPPVDLAVLQRRR